MTVLQKDLLKQMESPRWTANILYVRHENGMIIPDEPNAFRQEVLIAEGTWDESLGEDDHIFFWADEEEMKVGTFLDDFIILDFKENK